VKSSGCSHPLVGPDPYPALDGGLGFGSDFEPMSVWYLDVEDEITDAVGRLRAAQDDRVVLVVPPGSRIGTGRINFRLLAREAETRGRSVQLVSADSQVRAMAKAAGLDAFESVAKAEKAAREATGMTTAADAADSTGGNGTGAVDAAVLQEGAAAVIGATATATTVPEAPPSVAQRLRGKVRSDAGSTQMYAMTPRAASAAVNGSGAIVGAGTLAPERERPRTSGVSVRRKAAGWGVRLTLVGGVAVAGLYAGYLSMASATVTIRPTMQPVTWEETIAANPQNTTANAGDLVVPARPQPLTLDTGGTFEATGQRTVKIAATGVVRFTSHNTVGPVGIRKGTPVRTPGGIEFRTTQYVAIPRYFEGRQAPFRDVPVRAERKGRDGNVPRGTIRELNPTLGKLLVVDQGGGVTNVRPTSGGDEEQVRFVTEADYRRAQNTLQRELNAKLDEELEDPLNQYPGYTLYRDTAKLGEVTFQPVEEEVVDHNGLESFELAAVANATALAVEDQVLANTALEAFHLKGVPPGTTVAPETVRPEIGPGVWDEKSGTIRFPVHVEGMSYDQLDQAELRSRLTGKTISEAEQILAEYGEGEVSVWPDFLPVLPSADRQIRIDIPPPQESSP
jgi:hypothetical protein